MLPDPVTLAINKWKNAFFLLQAAKSRRGGQVAADQAIATMNKVWVEAKKKYGEEEVISTFWWFVDIWKLGLDSDPDGNPRAKKEE